MCSFFYVWKFYANNTKFVSRTAINDVGDLKLIIIRSSVIAISKEEEKKLSEMLGADGRHFHTRHWSLFFYVATPWDMQLPKWAIALMKCAPHLVLLPSSWPDFTAYCESTTPQGRGDSRRRFLRSKKKVAAMKDSAGAEGFVYKWLLQK